MARAAGSLAEQVALGAAAAAALDGSSGSASSAKGASGSPERVVQLSSGGDSPLPTGWQRVTHDSGLPCYVHEQQRLVCWSKPYVLDLLCSPGEFVAVAQQHVPPLSLFKLPHGHEKVNGEKANSTSGNVSRGASRCDTLYGR